MRIRRASWGSTGWPLCWRGWSIALITKHRTLNLELHYENRTNHQGRAK